MARSLRRHASLCGLASGGARGASDAESTFLVASKLFDLHAALAASDGGAAFIAASDLKAFANYGAVGLSPIAADAAPVAVAAALSGSAAPFHEKLTPALEAMRAEIICAAAGALIQLEKGARKKRIVVLGGGFCGAIVAHELTRGDSQGIDTEEFAVTLVDTKEFFEFTPSVLRLMADEKAEEKGMWKKSAIEFEKIMGGKGELIIGSAAAVRRDHVRTKETCQLDHPDLGHIFAGGDICHAGAFTVGERTMNAAIKHGFTIVKNLLKLVGMREGKMKKPLAHFTPGSEFLAVSLGNTNGLLYATDPNTASLFSTKAALEAERGPLKDAGIKGWMELNPAVDYIKFVMIPSAVYNYLVNNDYSSMDQFYGKEQAYLTIDVV